MIWIIVVIGIIFLVFAWIVFYSLCYYPHLFIYDEPDWTDDEDELFAPRWH